MDLPRDMFSPLQHFAPGASTRINMVHILFSTRKYIPQHYSSLLNEMKGLTQFTGRTDNRVKAFTSFHLLVFRYVKTHRTSIYSVLPSGGSVFPCIFLLKSDGQL